MRWSDIKEFIANQLYGVIRWTVSTASVDPSTRWVGIGGHEVDPSDPDVQWQARLMQHYGFSSMPKKGSEFITTSIGGEGNNAAIVAEHTPGKGPTDLVDGDVSAYGWNEGQLLRFNDAGDTALSTAGATLEIDNAGAMALDSPSGKDIVFNGGTHTVAREGDMADGGSLGVSLGAMGVAAITYFPPGSVLGTVVATLPLKTPIQVKLGPGAPRVKA